MEHIFSKEGFRLVLLLLVAMTGLTAHPGFAGPYRDSAHGDADHGVNRTATDGSYVAYATGNCAHCHEAHASLEGTEPAPLTGASAHALFAPTFNTARTQNPYVATDAFCFHCHTADAGPQVVNEDYSAVFGGAAAGTGPQSIMEAFNQQSYHNLYDIWNFLNGDVGFSPWFAGVGNPCSGCHNPHLAKRNWDSSQPGFPLLSAISKPSDHDNLWGVTQLMSGYTAYEAPFAAPGSREPAGIGDPNGANTPDYPGLCVECHNPSKVIYSTDHGRNLRSIDWLPTGANPDKHGAAARDGIAVFREPYTTAAATKSNFVLSCMDCHEAHGSQNILLLRRRINGENLEGILSTTDAMSYACKRCHPDDLAAQDGTQEANKWEYVHHRAADAPYERRDCADCHGIDVSDPPPIPCGNCHGHGKDDSWAGLRATGRKTF